MNQIVKLSKVCYRMNFSERFLYNIHSLLKYGYLNEKVYNLNNHFNNIKHIRNFNQSSENDMMAILFDNVSLSDISDFEQPVVIQNNSLDYLVCHYFLGYFLVYDHNFKSYLMTHEEVLRLWRDRSCYVFILKN